MGREGLFEYYRDVDGIRTERPVVYGKEAETGSGKPAGKIYLPVSDYCEFAAGSPQTD